VTVVCSANKHVCIRLDDKAVQIAIGLHLGIVTEGSHGLSCRLGPGRYARHAGLNDLIWRGLTQAGIHSVKEPQGMLRSDGKKPDGLTLIPWRSVRCMTWDVTVADTVALSNLATTSARKGGAAELAEARKEAKYTQLMQSHALCPIGL